MGSRFKAGGVEYDIPDDQVDAFMKDMDSRGVPFEGSTGTQRFQVDGQDYDIPTAKADAFRKDMQGRGLEVIDPSAPKSKVIEMPTQRIEGEVPEADWSDKLMAAGAGFTDAGTLGLPRLLPGGLGDRYGANIDAAIAKAPGYGLGGRVAGAVASPANLIAPGAGVAGNALLAAGQGGVESLAHGGDAEDVLADAALSGAAGLAVGTAAPALVRGGKSLVKSGLVNRARAALGGGAEKFAEREGGDALEALGREIEARGLHEGGFGPQPQQRYLDNAQALRGSAGESLGAAERDIAALPNEPQVYLQGVANDIRARGPEPQVAARDPRGAGRDARFRDELASNLVDAQGGYSPDIPFTDAVAQRRGYDDQVNYMRRGNIPMKEAAYRDAANLLRDESKGALNAGVDAGDVPAPLRDQWMGANDDFHVASQVLDNSAPYQPGMVERAAPVALGALGLGSGHPVLGAAAYGAAKYIGPRANSALAGIEGAGGRLMQGAGNALEQNVPAAVGLDRALSPQQSVGTGRGNLLGEAALDLLRSSPADLGKYQADIAQAAASPEPGAVNSLIVRLAQTDPDFRNGPLVQLQQMTAGSY